MYAELRDIVAPAAAFLFCAVIWISLPRLAREIGVAGLTVGLVYFTVLTRGFRRAPPQLKASLQKTIFNPNSIFLGL